MRRSDWTNLFVLFIGTCALGSCQQIFGIEEATLICPPDTPNCKFCDNPKGPSQ